MTTSLHEAVKTGLAVTCPHCHGTGECQKGQFVFNQPTIDGWYRCLKCGSGQYGSQMNTATKPVCSICGGKGFNKV